MVTDLLERASEASSDVARLDQALGLLLRVWAEETPDGMVRIEMQLEPEEAAIVWEAMMAAAYGAQPAGADSDASAEASPVADQVTDWMLMAHAPPTPAGHTTS